LEAFAGCFQKHFKRFNIYILKLAGITFNGKELLFSFLD
jgi:hypothetical protein